MNLVGKVFVVLIFVFSVVFMTLTLFVYAAHTNWRKLVENPPGSPGGPGLVHQLKTAKDDFKKLDELRGKEKLVHDAELAARKSALAKLETANRELTDERDQLRKQLETYTGELRAEMANLKTTHQALENLRNETVVLRQKIENAEKDERKHFNQVVKVTDEMHQLANVLDNVKDMNKKLADQYAKALEVLRKLKKEPEPDLYRNEPPLVDGVVTSVGDGNMIEVSLGTDDGLLPGHPLFVYRSNGTSNTLVGKIEIVKAAPDRAVGKSLREWAKSNIMKGDRVAAHIE